MQIERLRTRRLRWYARDYLVYRSLWPKIESVIGATMAGYPPQRRPVVLDVGCGEKPYADLFSEAHYVGLNGTREGACPDVIGDAQQLPVASESVDIVFSTQVIEHVPYPERMLREAWRVLRPEGRIILTGPFYWPLHEEPYDFYRFTKYGFERLLQDAGFDGIRVEGDCGAVTQVAVSVIGLLPRWLSPLVPFINIAAPWLERLSGNTKSTLNYAVSGRKVCRNPSTTRPAG